MIFSFCNLVIRASTCVLYRNNCSRFYLETAQISTCLQGNSQRGVSRSADRESYPESGENASTPSVGENLVRRVPTLPGTLFFLMSTEEKGWPEVSSSEVSTLRLRAEGVREKCHNAAYRPRLATPPPHPTPTPHTHTQNSLLHGWIHWCIYSTSQKWTHLLIQDEIIHLVLTSSSAADLWNVHARTLLDNGICMTDYIGRRRPHTWKCWVCKATMSVQVSPDDTQRTWWRWRPTAATRDPRRVRQNTTTRTLTQLWFLLLLLLWWHTFLEGSVSHTDRLYFEGVSKWSRTL